MNSNTPDSGSRTPPGDRKFVEQPPGLVPPNEKSEQQVIENVNDQIPSVVSPEMERKLLWKLDIRIIPVVMWIYLMNFMDRVSIGNARLFGMEEDLGMDPESNQFQLSVSILFVTYCLFETPSNMIIKKLQPARYLAGLTFFWGVTAMCTAFVNNYAALIACRLLLGVFEAGFFPGVVIYLSMFYNRKSVALRQAYFYGTSAIAGGVGGLVAYAIGEIDGAAGWRAWRWILLINGIPTILTAFVVPFILPNSPGSASFLTDQEKADLVLLREAEVGQTKSGQHLTKEDVKAGAKDWKTYAFAIAQFVGLGMLYSFSVFLPTIINGLGAGWSRQTVQALTVPVYISGFIVYIGSAYWSDKTQQRGLFCMGGFAVCIVGYAFLLANAGVGLSFAGTFIVAMGLWVSTGLAFSWVSANCPRYGKRAFASGMQITIGNSAGVAAPFLYASETGPEYIPGYSATIALLALGGAIYLVLHLWFKARNKKKTSGAEDWRIEGLSEEEIKELGEFNPRYLYTT
ncbi:hypothetical protein MBLNU230_g4833t1 [Neophaeotheca triangularis]